MAALVLAALLNAGPAGGTQSLPATDIEQAVQQAIAARLRDDGRAASVSVVGRVADQRLPVGRARVAVGDVGGPWPRIRAGVPVHLLVDERAVRSMTVWVEINEEREVMAYAADYPARRAGAGVAMRMTRINMACCTGHAVNVASEVSTLRTVHAVRAGAPVMQSDFEPMPDVVAQQRVDVEVARGPVHLSTVGTAMTDARIGDLVPVRAEPAQTLVRGRVIARNKVRVDE